MRHHRTVGPPSKPGHGRGSAPYGRSDSTSRPWGGASWTVEKQRASCKSRSWTRSWTLSQTWRGSLNISWIALVTSLPARAFTWTLASTPTKPTIQSNSKDRRHNSKEQRIQRLQTRGEPFCDVTRQHPHITCFNPRAPENARTNPRGFRGQRPEQRIWRKQNNFQPASCQQASTSN